MWNRFWWLFLGMTMLGGQCRAQLDAKDALLVGGYERFRHSVSRSSYATDFYEHFIGAIGAGVIATNALIDQERGKSDADPASAFYFGAGMKLACIDRPLPLVAFLDILNAWLVRHSDIDPRVPLSGAVLAAIRDAYPCGPDELDHAWKYWSSLQTGKTTESAK